MHAILLAGAALVGLPVLLHLIMKQEPKRLPFPAFRFLKQKQKTNQRKMRLRHFLLLALRMLLIALFCLTLYQPTLMLSGGFHLAAEQPVAAVFVFDTSPSMGYRVGESSRLEEARKRALSLLDDLPAQSRIAILDPGNPQDAAGSWELSLTDARNKIERLKEPQGSTQPVTTGVATAYRLLKTVDAESETPTPLPRLIVVFSDRAAACWDASRTEELTSLREAIPHPPETAHLFVDVGIDQPTNVAITSATISPQMVPAHQPVTVAVTVQATGADVPEAAVRCRLDQSGTPLSKPLQLTAGTPQAITFTLTDLKPGFHQVELSLETPDALRADDNRYATFRVREARQILTITDQPDDAIYWRLAHDKLGEFSAIVKTPAEVETQRIDFGQYEAVVLLSVADPTNLWRRLTDYVSRGGKLLIIPGGPEQVTRSAYDPTTNPAAAALLPGKLTAIVDVSAERPAGTEWQLSDAALRRHALLAPFREWKLRGNVDFLQNPRRIWKYWRVEADPQAVVITYDWPTDRDPHDPAILERIVGQGKVLLLTTRMDSPWDADRRWHNYWETAGSSWTVVFPNLLMRYLAGDSADANFQWTVGQTVTLPLPKGSAGEPRKLILEGPGVSGSDAFPEVSEDQTEYRLLPDRTRTAGNFVLRTEANDWREAFSLNLTAEESDLTKVSEAAITAVFGPNSIIPAAKEIDFRGGLDPKFNQPIDLFPWLLIAVLVLFALEGLIANRFYRPNHSPGNPPTTGAG
ncbi:MAG: BatA and WFA domain-containing protein [Bacteroidales bacterium]|nr:BatA and WFA domain-containing protein [Bacteroidales bacterium]